MTETITTPTQIEPVEPSEGEQTNTDSVQPNQGQTGTIESSNTTDETDNSETEIIPGQALNCTLPENTEACDELIESGGGSNQIDEAQIIQANQAIQNAIIKG